MEEIKPVVMEKLVFEHGAFVKSSAFLHSCILMILSQGTYSIVVNITLQQRQKTLEGNHEARYQASSYGKLGNGVLKKCQN